MPEDTETPAEKDGSQPETFVEVKDIANKRGAEVRVHEHEVFGRVSPKEAKSLAAVLLERLSPNLAALQEEIKKDPRKYSSLITENFGVGIDEVPGLLPRLLVSSGPSKYVIVTQEGEKMVAQLYAHIPAEVNDLVIPWLKDAGVEISGSTFIRP